VRVTAPPRAFAVCGFQGSGKTTLLEEVIRELRGRGLSVGAVKTDAHGLRVDGAGTDSDRLYRAGAEVAVLAPGEALHRRSEDEPGGGRRRAVEPLAARLTSRHDLVLVEGGKGSSLPKIWLGRPGEEAEPPANVAAVELVLPWDSERVAGTLRTLERLLDRDWSSGPMAGGVLAGGASRRMGTPKADLEIAGKTLLRRTGEILGERLAPVVRLGGDGGPWPCLPDPPGLVGPLAGMVAAQRWAPGTTWVFVACDLPRLSSEVLEWLLARRRPGTWAVIPRAGGVSQPLMAVYEPMLRPRLEALAGSESPSPSRLVGTERVIDPEVPGELEDAFHGANTSAEWLRETLLPGQDPPRG